MTVTPRKTPMGTAGYTIAEVLVAASIGLVIMAAVYAAMIMGQRSSASVERKVIAQQDARAALEIMSLEIRMASYNPSFSEGLWTEGSSSTAATCQGLSANQEYKGIQNATATSLSVQMDIDASSVIRDTSNEIIQYNYDTNNQYITRRTNCGTPQPFLGAQTGNARDVRVANQSTGIPLFRYYDGDGTEIPVSQLPGDIPDIRRIEITIVVDTEEIDPTLGQRRRMIYSTSVVPRNHPVAW